MIETKLIIITDIHARDLTEKLIYLERAHEMHKVVLEW
jgi:hypothetical protein